MEPTSEYGPVESRLLEGGFEIPVASPALASYQPAVRSGAFVFTAGQLPLHQGILLGKGPVGSVVSLETARRCAEQAALNALSAIRTLVPLSQIKSVVRLTGYVNAAPVFEEHPAVLNAASDLLILAFNGAGRHVRSAVGVSSLPLGASLELELTVALRD